MNKGHVLIVGDNPDGNDSLSEKLQEAHYRVKQIASAERALNALRKGMVDLIIADFQRSPTDSLGFLDKIRQLNNKPPVIINSEQPNVSQAVAAIKAGASDYLDDTCSQDHLVRVLDNAISLKHPVNNTLSEPVAMAPVSQQTLQMAKQVAQTDATVLITGESGTGKEVLARYIHQRSPRSNGPFIAINCAAIPDNLLESELFGHAKGAFTGATAQQSGRFELANNGTLLLDEIGELPLSLQAKLLRVLQEKEVERLGSRSPVKLNVRLLAATNQNLQEQVRLGQFREDLYYRINVFPMCWAPLRARPDDIIPIAEHFLVRHASGSSITLSEQACEQLRLYQWPGNVRELENVIQRALVLQQGNIIEASDLMLEQTTPSTPLSAAPLPATPLPASTTSQPEDIHLGKHRKQEEFKHIIQVLRQHAGHRGKTANALGVTTRTLRNKMAEMRREGIDIEALINESRLPMTEGD